MLATQPPLGARTMFMDVRDRLTGLGIYLAQAGSAVVSLIDFGYRRELRPAPFSPTILVAIALVASALTLRIWAIRTLGRFFTSTVHIAADHRVVEDGPYRWLRHPSYTGALLVPVGIAIASQSALGLALALLAGAPAYLYRIGVEEKALTESLGKAYGDYRTRTRRLIPFLF